MVDVGLEFMEKTKYQSLGRSDQQEGVPAPSLEKEPDPSAGCVDLPDPRSTAGSRAYAPVDLTEAIAGRVSVRKYSEAALTLGELAYLLWCTQGVKEILGARATLRTVPSGGARHPFETYVVVNRVEGLAPGVYRYLALSHRLQVYDESPESLRRIHEATLKQYVEASAVTLIWAAVPYRAVWRYQARAYRYMIIDAGHICQNLYLAVQAVGAGCCAIAAYDDDKLNEALGLDGKTEFVLYLATVGRVAGS